MRLSFLFFCSLACGALFAQPTDSYTAIAERLAEYGRLTMDWEPKGLLDLTDPELFEFIPRPVLQEQMMGLTSDDNMEVRFSDFTIDRIGEIVRHQGVEYAPIDFHHGMHFRLKSAAYRTPEMLARLSRMLEKSYGRVTVDRAASSIELTARKAMYAIRRGPNQPWYFVEYRPENAAMIDLLVPPGVREQFKK